MSTTPTPEPIEPEAPTHKPEPTPDSGTEGNTQPPTGGSGH